MRTKEDKEWEASIINEIKKLQEQYKTTPTPELAEVIDDLREQLYIDLGGVCIIQKEVLMRTKEDKEWEVSIINEIKKLQEQYKTTPTPELADTIEDLREQLYIDLGGVCIIQEVLMEVGNWVLRGNTWIHSDDIYSDWLVIGNRYVYRCDVFNTDILTTIIGNL